MHVHIYIRLLNALPLSVCLSLCLSVRGTAPTNSIKLHWTPQDFAMQAAGFTTHAAGQILPPGEGIPYTHRGLDRALGLSRAMLTQTSRFQTKPGQRCHRRSGCSKEELQTTRTPQTPMDSAP